MTARVDLSIGGAIVIVLVALSPELCSRVIVAEPNCTSTAGISWPSRSAVVHPTQGNNMGIRLGGIVVDATDLHRLARFWSRLLDLEITRQEEGWVSLGPSFALQRVPEPKTAKNRIHVDLVTDDFSEAIARATALGATAVGEIQEDLWQVWQDPEGNEFCICVS
jgi:predicted enzyme related to lactoylglutathione lyase